jgi:polysaccharide export outer membrane protein
MLGACCWLLAAALTPSSDAPEHAVRQPPRTPVSPSASLPPGYRIGPEDLLEIDVWNRAELSRKVPVRPDGRISLPLLNDVLAAGLTPMELRDELLKRLTEFEAAPEVSVIVTEVHSFRVSVLGEVARPGRFELKSPVRLVDALAMAGGLTQFASRSNILVLRSKADGLETLRFDYDRLRAADPRALTFPLQTDDVLLVP